MRTSREALASPNAISFLFSFFIELQVSAQLVLPVFGFWRLTLSSYSSLETQDRHLFQICKVGYLLQSFGMIPTLWIIDCSGLSLRFVPNATYDLCWSISSCSVIWCACCCLMGAVICLLAYYISFISHSLWSFNRKTSEISGHTLIWM